MILGPPMAPHPAQQAMEMFGNLGILNDSGADHDPHHNENGWKRVYCQWMAMIMGTPALPTPQQTMRTG